VVLYYILYLILFKKTSACGILLKKILPEKAKNFGQNDKDRIRGMRNEE
jgi:hypothetical protein